MNYLRERKRLFLAVLAMIASCHVGFARGEANPADRLVSESTISTIAFGSCNSEKKPQPLWPVIASENPDVWIWTGDNIYADTEDPAVFRQKYDLQLNNPEYRKFTNSVGFLTGTWDDHDYGVNDGGADYPQKELAKAELYRFLNVESDDPSRARDGVYRSYDFGPTERRVRVILLDTRWFRSELERTSGPDREYLPNTTGTILGEAQWQWLSEQLADDSPQVTIIVSSIQVVAREHRFEKWGNFPNELDRFYKHLERHAPKNTVVISGDRHVGEISAQDISGWSQPLLDVTSSGLTNSWSRMFDETNSRAVTPKVIENNYGVVEIDWSSGEPDITVSLRGLQGALQSIRLKG